MRKGSKLSDLSIDQLLERKDKTIQIYRILTIFMIIASAVTIYLAIKSKNYALIAVAMGSFLTLLAGYAEITKIKKEIRMRGHNL